MVTHFVELQNSFSEPSYHRLVQLHHQGQSRATVLLAIWSNDIGFLAENNALVSHCIESSTNTQMSFVCDQPLIDWAIQTSFDSFGLLESCVSSKRTVCVELVAKIMDKADTCPTFCTDEETRYFKALLDRHWSWMRSST